MMQIEDFDPIAYIQRIFSMYGFNEDDIRNEIVNFMEEQEQFKEWIEE